MITHRKGVLVLVRSSRRSKTMDIEKNIEFIIEQQARFETNLQKLLDSQAETDRRIRTTERVVRAFIRAGNAQVELHWERMDALERRMDDMDQRFQAFLERFDAFLRGSAGGNGHTKPQS
jgi:septation ring formation regulator EzrA